MKRLLSLLLCLMLMVPAAVAEEAASLTLADLLAFLPRLLEGGTVAVELPEQGSYALTLNPDRPDFARIDLPEISFIATAGSLMVEEDEQYAAITWDELFSGLTGASLSGLQSDAAALAEDAQAVWAALQAEFLASAPIAATGGDDDGFFAAGLRVDIDGLADVIYRTLETERERVNRILTAVNRHVDISGYHYAAALEQVLYNFLHYSGLAGQTLTVSLGGSAEEGAAAFTALAECGPYRLTLTMADGDLSGALTGEGSLPDFTITGTAAVGDGFHLSLNVSADDGSIPQANLHIAYAGSGFTLLGTCGEATVSGSFTSYAGFQGSVNFGSSFSAKIVYGPYHQLIKVSAGGLSLRASYSTQRVWVEDESYKRGGYYASTSTADLEARCYNDSLTVRLGGEGLELSGQIARQPFALHLPTGMDTLFLSLGGNSVNLESAGGSQVTAQVTTAEGLMREYVLQLRYADMMTVDLMEGGTRLLTVTADPAANRIPLLSLAGDTPIAVLSVEALGGKVDAVVNAVMESLK